MTDICDKRLDIEIVKWVATGPPDSYGRSINSVALAREVLNLRAETDGMRGMLADSIVVHHDDRAEIDRLRAQLDAPRSLCGECGGFLVLRCEHCGTVHGDTTRCDGEDCSDPIYAGDGTHSPLCSVRVADEIAEVTEQITCGHPTCGATWRDTEANGWLWYCSLPHGHEGSHRCIGASW